MKIANLSRRNEYIKINKKLAEPIKCGRGSGDNLISIHLKESNVIENKSHLFQSNTGIFFIIPNTHAPLFSIFPVAIFRKY